MPATPSRILHLILLVSLLSGLFLPIGLSAQEATPVPTLLPAVDPTAEPTVSPLDAQIETLLQRMSVADRVGQLFVITFQGRKTDSTSEIAELIRDYRIGGVVLSAESGNLSNTTGADTARQVAILANQLQAMVQNIYLTPDEALNPAPDRLIPPTPGQFSVGDADVGVPLLVGVQQAGDDLPNTELRQGFTPLPSHMALGATWNPDLARSVGEIVGVELRAVGVNLLLGPTLDVLEQPRRDNVGGQGIYTFGSDAYWVGEMGRAYIEGVHTGSEGRIATIANHFPGQGGSDRRPDEEVATIQKSLQELRRMELPPFAGVTRGPSSILSPDGDPTNTDGLMSSHIRYSGFQTSRERTPPISLAAPQLGTIMDLEEFSGWRKAGGILMSDELGLPAVRLYYDPTLQTFPKRRIALDAFLAGNDLLYLSRFGLSDTWDEERSNIKETISFFRERYTTDPDITARVDAAVRRILRLKLGLYAGSIDLADALVTEAHFAALGDETAVERHAVVSQVARESVTVLYPDPQGLSDPLPAAPQPDERMVIFSTSRPQRECGACRVEPAIPANGLQEIMLRLYGPGATGQLDPDLVRSFTFEDLNQVLNDSAAPQLAQVVEEELAEADWLIFAMLDVDLERYPNSDAVKQFLRLRSDRLRGKRMVVLALNAPYFLDATEISKLTAYFGVYSRTQPFLENAVRALFRGYPMVGAPPVSVPGTRFSSLIERLEPDPNQVIVLQLVGESAPVPVDGGSSDAEGQVDVSVGDSIRVQAGPVLDLNGHRAPDGTPVAFRLIYEGEELALPTEPIPTVNGMAAISAPLERSGTLRISASSGQAVTSVSILVSIQGESPATIATVVPTLTPVPQPTDTPVVVPASQADVAPDPDAPPAPRTVYRVNLATLGVAFVTMLVMISLMLVVLLRIMPRQMLMYRMLWASIAGLAAYLLYGLGWLPGIDQLQAALNPWGVAPVVFVAMLVTLVWMQLVQES